MNVIDFITQLGNDVKSNLLYGSVVVVLLGFFSYECYTGEKFFSDSGVQKNAGYHGPVPHSGYGVRFYHK